MRPRITLTAALLVTAVLISGGCLVKLSSDPQNVSVVVGTKIARHSRSDSVLPLQILVRNNSAGTIHIDAGNFVIRDEYGIEHLPVAPGQIRSIYKRVSFDYELANTTEFIGLLNSGMGQAGNLRANFYPNNSDRMIFDRFDMPSVSRMVDILYYEIEDWPRMKGTLTMVVKNLRDRPPLEVPSMRDQRRFRNNCVLVVSPVQMPTPLPADDVPSTSLKMGGTHFLLCFVEGTSSSGNGCCRPANFHGELGTVTPW